MKKTLKIFSIVAVALLILTACAQAPEPSKFNVPSWLVGTWSNSEAGITVEATSTNIIVKVGEETTDLLEFKNSNKNIMEVSSEAYYTLKLNNSVVFDFEKNLVPELGDFIEITTVDLTAVKLTRQK